jgi:hypothetical protein
MRKSCDGQRKRNYRTQKNETIASEQRNHISQKSEALRSTKETTSITEKTKKDA